MRILMVGRKDVNSVPGGDSVQMRETKAGLERLGVEVTTATIDTLPALSSFDILHVFNLDQLESVLLAQKASLRKAPPIVLSTIYWNHTGHWFDEAVSAHKSWRLIHRSLGNERSRRFYEGWQQLKLRRGKCGWKLRRHLSIPAQLLPNSELEVDHLKTVFGRNSIPAKKVTIVPNGVRRELFDPKPMPNRLFSEQYGLKNFILQVARIQAAKNQLGLIEALFDLPAPIVFIGQPSPYEAEYVNRCYARARARGNVHFLGSRSPQELAGIYALAAVHALPSWRETPGLASLEAAAAGCRIVSTEVGSAREYFGSLAWYCDPRDPVNIRRAVMQAMKSPPSGELRERILESYTWDMAAKVTLEAYARILESGEDGD
jgi:glycosyltransferase involved in cell wall biosynthesis